MTIKTFAAALALALCLTADGAGAQTSDDQAAIAKVLADSSAGWTRGDLDAFMDSYEKAPQINYVSGGKVIQGYDAIRAVYAPRFAKPAEMARLSTEIVDFDPLGSDYAAVVGRYRLKMRDGQEATGLFSVVFRRTTQGWRIVSDHSS